jgi:glycosyltransferase involved in cell wall biosynthesis
MGKKLIVIAAFACDPTIPSEPAIGWAYVRTWAALSQTIPGVEVIAVMNGRSKKATDAELSRLGLSASETPRTVGLDVPGFLRFLQNRHLTRFEYLVWNLQARRYFKKLPPDQEVVLARHVTFASELLPTPISVLRDRAFTVWGPVGSSGAADAFRIRPRRPLWRYHFAQQKLRDALSRIRSRSIGRGVDLVLATSGGLADGLESSGVRAKAFPNTRVDPQFLALIDERPKTDSPSRHATSGRGLKLVCVGHLVYSKRFELAMATLTDPRLQDAKLLVIGKPPSGNGSGNYLMKVAAALNVQDRVEFAGHLPQKEVLKAMLEADVLIHPSSREGGSGVVGEATAVGVPVVCFKGTGSAAVLEYAGGHGVQVDASAGTSAAPLAEAVIAASHLGFRPAGIWRTDRYAEVEAGLYHASPVSVSPGS